MLIKNKNKAYSGYTLVELSVVISIIAVLVGSTLMLGTVRIDKQKVSSTKDRIAMIERALKNYMEINNRLPCPADAKLNRNSPNFGLASGPAGNCTTGSIKATRSFNMVSGMTVSGTIPVTDLALPPDIMFDNWGRKITYVVDSRYTAADALRFNRQNSTCGGIIIENEAGDVITSNAIYVVLSHGKDGHGAYHGATGAPWQLDAAITNVSALDNAGIAADGSDDFDNVFRSQGYVEDATNSSNVYDDILSYKTRKDIRLINDSVADNFSLNGQPVPDGWVYVPPYTLPSGKQVAGFEVMKYLASDANSDGIPESVPNQAPWYDVSYQTARAACQRLGYTSVDSATGNNLATGDGKQMEYDVISETQSISIADQAVRDSRNWVDSCYGSSFVSAGHRDGSPGNPIAADDDDENGYYLTGNSDADNTDQKRAQRRTHYMPSGAVIWDLSGNVNQWSYCDLDYPNATPPYTLCKGNGKTDGATYTNGFVTGTGWYDYNVSGGIESTTSSGRLIDLLPPDGLNNTQFLGSVNVNNASKSGGVNRGSAYNAVSYTGLYRVRLGYNTESSIFAQGFRCVHNLNPGTINPRNLPGLDIWYDASDIDGDFVDEWDAGTATEASTSLLKTGATCSAASANAGCVARWINKAGNGKYNALSARMNGAASGADTNRPTLKLNAINGRPAVHFASGTKQWVDTYHGVSITSDDGTDDGSGYSFDGKKEFTMFFVANGSNLNGLLTAEDDLRSQAGASSYPYPQFIYFPIDIAGASGYTGSCPAIPGSGCGTPNYVLMLDTPMAGSDAANTYCALPGTTNTSGGTACAHNAYATSYNAACAKLGGITNTKNGLSNNITHIGTAVFKAGVANGLVAYVDGATFDAQDSAVEVKDEAMDHNNLSCKNLPADPLNPVDIKLIVGAQRYLGDSTGAAADLAEVIIYNRALSNKERVLVEQYLADKYGVDYKGPSATQ